MALKRDGGVNDEFCVVNSKRLSLIFDCCALDIWQTHKQVMRYQDDHWL